jgi:hypothetical protein
MKHLETELVDTPNGPLKRPRKPRTATSLTAIVISLVLAVSAGGFAMTSLWGPAQSDTVTSVQKAELVNQFTRIRSISMEQVKTDDLEQVLDGMRLDPVPRRALKQTLEKPATPTDNIALAKIVLWDSMAQDGDVVRVVSAGYSVDVPLLKQHTMVMIPVDGSRLVQLIGVTDGGGGITVGVQNGDGQVSLPVLSGGQVLNLPVTF